LTSERQIHIIQTANIKQIYFNPQLSDDVSSPPAAKKAIETDSAERLKALPRSTATASVDPTDIQHHRRDWQSANRVYAETLRKSRELIRQVCAGNTEAVAGVQGVVGGLTGQLTDDAWLGLADLVTLKTSDQSPTLHGLNTCILALLVGRELEIAGEELQLLGTAALLHDVGEHRIPSQVRMKIDQLTRAEVKALRLHPQYGKEFIEQVNGLPPIVSEIIYQHHEHLDGSGYPRGLREADILPLAMILRVADEYSYLVNHPDPVKCLTPAQALSTLYVKRQQELSQKVVVALVHILSVYPPGTFVELSNGSIGLIMTVNYRDRLKPLVAVKPKPDSHDGLCIMDLSADPTCSISRTLQRWEVPEQLIASINPQQVLGFLLITEASRKRS
jgi:HD-GYP domain-containing protein (c-di-GMP phosphodiesterase class II)